MFCSMETPDKLSAEMPKRRPSFRSQLSRSSRSSRISESPFSDRSELLAETNEDIDDGKPPEG